MKKSEKKLGSVGTWARVAVVTEALAEAVGTVAYIAKKTL